MILTLNKSLGPSGLGLRLDARNIKSALWKGRILPSYHQSATSSIEKFIQLEPQPATTQAPPKDAFLLSSAVLATIFSTTNPELLSTRTDHNDALRPTCADCISPAADLVFDRYFGDFTNYFHLRHSRARICCAGLWVSGSVK